MWVFLGIYFGTRYYNLTEDHLREMLIFANAGAALVTTKKGAICSMPERREIVDLIDVGRN